MFVNFLGYSYPRNHVSTNQQNCENPRTLAPTNKYDFAVHDPWLSFVSNSVAQNDYCKVVYDGSANCDYEINSTMALSSRHFSNVIQLLLFIKNS